MKITYNKKVDAAYVYIAGDDKIKPGVVKRTYLCDPKETGSMINLDFDQEDRLFGIEVLDASKVLPHDILGKAEVK